MDKGLLFVSDVHKGSVQGRHHFLDSAEEGIAHREAAPAAGLFVQFNQPVVFLQGDLNFRRSDVNDQIL